MHAKQCSTLHLKEGLRAFDSQASKQVTDHEAALLVLQDSARSFAGTASDEEKYQLYMAATGFDAVIMGLAKSQQEVSDWHERLQGVREKLQVWAQFSLADLLR